MLQDSLVNRIFIRASIIGLRSITPLSLVYCGARLFGLIPLPHSHGVAIMNRCLDVYCAVEACFYTLVYLPRKWLSNRPAKPYCPLNTPAARLACLKQTWKATSEPEPYLSLWFHRAPIANLHREDVKDFLFWRLWNLPDRLTSAESELESYLDLTETTVNTHFKPGRGPHKAMAVTLEPIRSTHRPLLYYAFLIGGADLQFSLLMLLYGYKHFRLSHLKLLTTLPFRPIPALSLHQSPAAHLSYWHLPHTSPTHHPILFIHAVGIGLQFYLSFFHEFLSGRQVSDGEIGIIAIEYAPVSARITHPTLPPHEMASEIHAILTSHAWDKTKVLLITHSYGTLIAAHLLHSPLTHPLIGPLLFIDPVAFTFHDPHVPFNFLRRAPKTASEIQLQFFASTDPGVAAALTHQFGFWADNSLWREDLVGREWRTTVVLAGGDIIVETKELGRYLLQEDGGGVKDEDGYDEWMQRKWTGRKEIEVVWLEGINHSEAFDTRDRRGRVWEVVEGYCAEKSWRKAGTGEGVNGRLIKVNGSESGSRRGYGTMEQMA